MRTFRTIFFDLDDTLYPQNSGLWRAMGERIHDYMMVRLGVTEGEARALRAEYLHAFGTTLNGLMANHQIDPLDYLQFIHDIPIEKILPPNPRLRELMASLPQRKVIFTNASLEHAERVLRHLQVGDQFDLVIDIVSLEYHNKPRVEAYQRAMQIAAESDPELCLMVDDRTVNLEPAGAMGMTTVLVGEDSDGGGYEPDYQVSTIDLLAEEVVGLHRALSSKDSDAR
jgi:putative hydrolase of the HAD superfamily